jgi:predicted DNA-binding protein (MmcQ/YjbR family)
MAAKKLSRAGNLVRDRALSYPQTKETFPWGEHAFKVKDKTFVFMRDDDKDACFSVKLSDSRAMALGLPGAEPTHYGMGAKGWVTIPLSSKISAKTLYALIDESFRAVAPKTVLKGSDP